jgi:hypothetical protein
VKKCTAALPWPSEANDKDAAFQAKLSATRGAIFIIRMRTRPRGLRGPQALDLGGRSAEAAGDGPYSNGLLEHLRCLFEPADPAFNAGQQFFAWPTLSRRLFIRQIDEMERLSAPEPVSWVKTMLSDGKALVAANEEAERYSLEGLGQLRRIGVPASASLACLWRLAAPTRAPLRQAGDIFDALGASRWSDGRLY